MIEMQTGQGPFFSSKKAGGLMKVIILFPQLDPGLMLSALLLRLTLLYLRPEQLSVCYQF
jgi:hypothetical protein